MIRWTFCGWKFVGVEIKSTSNNSMASTEPMGSRFTRPKSDRKKVNENLKQILAINVKISHWQINKEQRKRAQSANSASQVNPMKFLIEMLQFLLLLLLFSPAVTAVVTVVVAVMGKIKVSNQVWSLRWQARVGGRGRGKGDEKFFWHFKMEFFACSPPQTRNICVKVNQTIRPKKDRKTHEEKGKN